jgi:hypothetical protein
MGTLMPTMPTCTRRVNSRATPPSLVKHRHAVAEFVVVDQLQRLGEVRHAHAGQHRAEDLFLVDAHGRRDVVEQRAAGEEATFQAGTFRPRPSTTSVRLPSATRCRCSPRCGHAPAR